MKFNGQIIRIKFIIIRIYNYYNEDFMNKINSSANEDINVKLLKGRIGCFIYDFKKA